jgi:subtilisin family serine protease
MLLSAVAGIGLVSTANANGSAPPRTGHEAAKPVPSLLPAGHSWTVTLLTGDVVHVTSVAGRPPLVSVDPRPGDIFTRLVTSRGDIEVIPQSVMPLIGRVLDPSLFDVTTLILNGDDDAHRSFLPLIVQGSGLGPAGLASLLVRGANLSSIGAVAAEEPHTAARRAGVQFAAMATALTRAGGRVTPEVTGGIGHVWLDLTIHPTRLSPALGKTGPVLDHNLSQIGAPAAWRAGDTGAGVKVAVLDTGVDATFPDLRGQIAAERNFTSANTGVVTDKIGHGTYVASLIAGTGRASGGQRRGVAFGAHLVIGKVFSNQGEGLESWAIAAMQWAATRARVVSMSFSTGPSAGYDPMSHAVDNLTTTDHVLFVAAAGNYGPSDETVGSPAAAKAALGVGAVNGRDQLSVFSSRGPLMVNYAIKPEITAPGVNIAGARAAGTTLSTPINARYIVASGTSAAAPEVAGAAAILAALHPGWSPARLKADIISAAHPATGGDIYALGGGCVDIATAITDQVAASTPIAALGAASFSARTQRTTVTWGNTSQHAVSLRLSVELTDHYGHQAPRQSYALTRSAITVAGGGTATAGLLVRPGLLPERSGLYEGAVIARYGQVTVRTPISFYLKAPTRTLTIHLTPLPGSKLSQNSGYAVVFSLTDPDVFAQSTTVYDALAGIKDAKLQVPVGRYWVMATASATNTSGTAQEAVLGYPEVNITKNTNLVLDGATASPVTASVPGIPTITDDAGIHVERDFAEDDDGIDLVWYPQFDGPTLFYVNFTGSPQTGSFSAYSWFRLSNPAGSKSYYAYDLYHSLLPADPANTEYQVTPAEQAKLAKVTVHFYAVDGNTGPVMDNRYGLTPSGFLDVQDVSPPVPGGTTRIDYVGTGPEIQWNQDVAPPMYYQGVNQDGSWAIVTPGFTSYAPGSQHVLDWEKEPFAPGPYSGTKFTPSGCAPLPSVRVQAYLHVELTDLQDQPDGFDCLGGMYPQPFWALATSRTMSLYQGSRLVGTRHASLGTFSVPPQAATYKLTYTDNTSQVLPVSTRTTTTWTFRSVAPAGTAEVPIPLLLVRYNLPLGFGNHPDGSTATLSVARVANTPRAKVTGLRLWTSLNSGTTWQPAPVRALGDGLFAVTLPHAAPGQGVSLHVIATDAGGSAVDQTIITAYHG